MFLKECEMSKPRIQRDQGKLRNSTPAQAAAVCTTFKWCPLPPFTLLTLRIYVLAIFSQVTKEGFLFIWCLTADVVCTGLIGPSASCRYWVALGTPTLQNIASTLEVTLVLGSIKETCFITAEEAEGLNLKWIYHSWHEYYITIQYYIKYAGNVLQRRCSIKEKKTVLLINYLFFHANIYKSQWERTKCKNGTKIESGNGEQIQENPPQKSLDQRLQPCHAPVQEAPNINAKNVSLASR